MVALYFNMACSCVHQRAGAGQVRAGVCSEGVGACLVPPLNLCIHHLSSLWLPDPSRFTHARVPPSSPLSGEERRTRWHLSWQQLSVSPINYTGWLTPSPTLIRAFIHPLGISTSYDSTHLSPNHRTNAHRHFFPPTAQRIVSQTHNFFSLVVFYGCHWICCTLQCILMANVWLLPGFRLNLPCKKSPRMENSTDPGFARSHLDPPEGASSGVQSQRRDVWGGEGLEETPPGCLGCWTIWEALLFAYVGMCCAADVVVVFYPLWTSVQLEMKQCETSRITSFFKSLVFHVFYYFDCFTHLVSFSSRSSFPQTCFNLFYECDVCFHLLVKTLWVRIKK